MPSMVGQLNEGPPEEDKRQGQRVCLSIVRHP